MTYSRIIIMMKKPKSHWTITEGMREEKCWQNFSKRDFLHPLSIFFTLQRFSKDAKISWLVSAKFWQNFMRIVALTIMDWIIIASIFTSIFYHNKRLSFVQRIELKRMRKESPQKAQSMRRRRRRGKSAWKIWFMHVHVCSVSVQRNIFSNYESK